MGEEWWEIEVSGGRVGVGSAVKVPVCVYLQRGIRAMQEGVGPEKVREWTRSKCACVHAKLSQ